MKKRLLPRLESSMSGKNVSEKRTIDRTKACWLFNSTLIWFPARVRLMFPITKNTDPVLIIMRQLAYLQIEIAYIIQARGISINTTRLSQTWEDQCGCVQQYWDELRNLPHCSNHHRDPSCPSQRSTTCENQLSLGRIGKYPQATTSDHNPKYARNGQSRCKADCYRHILEANTQCQPVWWSLWFDWLLRFHSLPNCNQML